MKFIIDYPEIMKEWDYEINKEVDPSKVKKSSRIKYGFVCHKKHKWFASPHNRTNKVRPKCPYCKNKKVCEENCLATLFPEIAKQWHPTKNGKLTPFDVIAGSSKKYWFKCDVADDHEWDVELRHRTLNKSNCPFCDGEKTCVSNCLATLFPEIGKEWHPTKNGKLTPFDVVPGSGKKIWWKCEKGHEWKSKCCYRVLLDRKCSLCTKKHSKGEELIKTNLTKKEISFNFEYYLQYGGRADFYLPNLNLIIEYQGSQHYIPRAFSTKQENDDLKIFINAIERDIKKEIFCKNNNIKLIKIPFWELKNIEIILDYILTNREYKFAEPPNSVKKHENKVKLITERFYKKLENGLVKGFAA